MNLTLYNYNRKKTKYCSILSFLRMFCVDLLELLLLFQDFCLFLQGNVKCVELCTKHKSCKLTDC